jgi:hypothetical protein
LTLCGATVDLGRSGRAEQTESCEKQVECFHVRVIRE